MRAINFTFGGRPKGKVMPQMSLRPLAAVLQSMLGRPVRFVATDWQDGRAARTITAAADAAGCDIILPIDVVVAQKIEAGAPWRIVAIDSIGVEDMILGIGPDTVAIVNKRLVGARTVVWNGPAWRLLDRTVRPRHDLGSENHRALHWHWGDALGCRWRP